ncbi:hypothetical protein J8273_5736 [Carpediemonas membranifera]|uniref:Uncharacterized protein n=1 Tax=Carpediemonas membranifera TaxID=201153 RepID=A0A8J6B4N6_9EUKA|nr:hypothetical protein J8273_5736 [Carpediemonas membranifera]|eukprot:KAG9392924.1 hypothetical protein J8273_5736 [Carpediemonas membranifera]
MSKPSIFDRLNDPSSFHGTHAHRFDGDGHGRGLAGRDSVAKGGSNATGAYHGGAVGDLSQITRTGLREGGPTAAKSPRGPAKSPRDKPAAKSAAKPAKGGSIFDRLTDPSTYHGTHAHRFDTEGHGRGLGGRETIAKGGTGAAGAYHGGDVKDLSQITRTGLREGGKSPRDGGKSPRDKPVAKPAAKPAVKGGSIFDRLTDPSTYHGTHAHRFDAGGHGLGLDGRDSVSKGGAGASAYHGGAVADLSQITRK